MNLKLSERMLVKIGVGVTALFCLTGVKSANALTFNEAGPSATDIDTNPATTVDLNVSTTGRIEDLNLAMDLGTTYWNNMKVSLSHNSTTVEIMPSQDDSFARFNAVFDDEASQSLPTFGDASGTFLPSQSLSAFDRQELSGIWTLSFTDNLIPGDGSNLVSWSISGTTDSPTAVPFELNPNLGLLLLGGLFGGSHLYRKFKTKKVVFDSEE